MINMDTIFAPICPLGGSVVSVRFSGKNAFDVLDFFCISKEKYLSENLFFAKLKRNASAKHVIDDCDNNCNSVILDEVVVKIFHEPNSFTGENIVEIDLHASRFIVDEFLSLVSTIPNFRFAKNGEFSKRAFLNGKIDLIKCEGINSIIRAETKQQQKLANAMLSGEIYKKYVKIRDDLLNALSLVETNIDFSEEEIPKNIIDDVRKITDNLIKELTICISDKKAIDKINNGVSVAIIGKPNVGKSTLFNWLAKRDMAIVSPVAGTTRDVLNVEVDLDGYKVIFYDTAGIRKDSSDIIEQEGIKRAENIKKDADICIYVFDNNSDVNDYKEYINDDNAIVLVNKSDLLTKQHNNNDNILNISLLKQQNLDILMDNIKEKVLKHVELKHDPMVLNERHNILLNQCVEALRNIDFDSMQIEIIGEELRIACDKIGQITGQIYTDDILDNIFNKFCIGK